MSSPQQQPPSNSSPRPRVAQVPNVAEQEPPPSYSSALDTLPLQQQPVVYPMQQNISGPPQLPSLVKGQKIQSGPYTVIVTEEMVAQRERENQELFRRWYIDQQRRNRLPGGEDDYEGFFKDHHIRRIFIRKVFCILSFQLIFTALFVALFMFVEEAKIFMLMHWYLWVAAFCCFLFCYCAISCSDCARRQMPFIFICLCLLTLAMSYMAAFVSIYYSIEAVLLAIGMTAMITLIVSMIATFTKFDLTKYTGMMMIVALVGILAIIVMTLVLLFTNIKILQVTIAIVGTLLISTYLFFDVQTIMGGRVLELHPQEVIYATTQVYVDVILLYKYVLMFMGSVSNN